MVEGKSLLTSPNLIQTPVIQVKIGDQEFGVYKINDQGGDIYQNYVQ